MVENGLLECDPSLEDPACAVQKCPHQRKLVECTVSVGMLILVAYGMVRWMRADCRISFYLFVSTFMGLTLAFLVAFYLDSDLPFLSYLAVYSYDVYFSIIVLKVGLKLIQIMRHNINYAIVRRVIIWSFGLYQALLLAILIYESVQVGTPCAATPFLIANVISLTAAILFVCLGIKHNREQQRKIDESLAQGMQNNPLPRFRCWILTNFIGQVLVLTESIIYQVNQCKFSQVNVDIFRIKQQMKYSLPSLVFQASTSGSPRLFTSSISPRTHSTKTTERGILPWASANRDKQKWSISINRKYGPKQFRCECSLKLYFFNQQRKDLFNSVLIIVMKDQLIEHNPYKVMPLGALEGNCVGKAAVSYVLGGAMGLVMAMFMNAVEMREIEIGKVRRSTPIVLRKDWRKMKGTSKGFATFGGIFVFFECLIEHVRGKQDGLNSFLSGFGTSVVLGGNIMGRKELFYSGMGGGLMCVAFYKVFKWMGH